MAAIPRSDVSALISFTRRALPFDTY